MAVRIEFETSNAAFADGGAAEIAWVLRQIARRIDPGDGGFDRPDGGTVHDSNGNRIGQWSARIDADQTEE